MAETALVIIMAAMLLVMGLMLAGALLVGFLWFYTLPWHEVDKKYHPIIVIISFGIPIAFVLFSLL